MRDHEIAKKREDCLEYINWRGGGGAEDKLQGIAVHRNLTLMKVALLTTLSKQNKVFWLSLFPADRKGH